MGVPSPAAATTGTLDGRTVLVTGGGTGIGAAIARTFAGAGAVVTVAGRRPDPLADVAEGTDAITAATLDVTDEHAVTTLFADRGPFDIVVANAGAVESAPATRTSLDRWDRLIDVNLTGTFLTLREALRQPSTGWGRLLAIASTAGLVGYPYVAAYCAAKHGTVGLVRALAKEVAGSGVTVNAICPGYTDTPLVERSLDRITEATGRSTDDALAGLLQGNPTGRLVRPEEVAATALWLCGPGSDMVTGQAIAVDGGET